MTVSRGHHASPGVDSVLVESPPRQKQGEIAKSHEEVTEYDASIESSGIYSQYIKTECNDRAQAPCNTTIVIKSTALIDPLTQQRFQCPASTSHKTEQHHLLREWNSRRAAQFCKG